jgi:hypothetical protein
MNGCPVFPEDQRLVKVIMLSGAVGEIDIQLFMLNNANFC